MIFAFLAHHETYLSYVEIVVLGNRVKGSRLTRLEVRGRIAAVTQPASRSGRAFHSDFGSQK